MDSKTHSFNSRRSTIKKQTEFVFLRKIEYHIHSGLYFLFSKIMQTKILEKTEQDIAEKDDIVELEEIITKYKNIKEYSKSHDLFSMTEFNIIIFSPFAIFFLLPNGPLFLLRVMAFLWILFSPNFLKILSTQRKNTITNTLNRMTLFLQEKYRIFDDMYQTSRSRYTYQEIDTIVNEIQDILFLQKKLLRSFHILQKTKPSKKIQVRFRETYTQSIHYMHREILSLHDELRSLMKQSVSEIQWAVDDIRALEDNSLPDIKIGQLLEVRLTEQEKQFEMLLEKMKITTSKH